MGNRLFPAWVTKNEWIRLAHNLDLFGSRLLDRIMTAAIPTGGQTVGANPLTLS